MMHNGRTLFTVPRTPGDTEPEFLRAYGLRMREFPVGVKPAKVVTRLMRNHPHSVKEIRALKQATCEDGHRFREANKVGIEGERDEVDTVRCLRTDLLFRAGGRCPGCPCRKENQ